MFTLKLFRKRNGQLVTKILAVHHVQTMQIGEKGNTLEVWAFRNEHDNDCYYIGEKEKSMTALNDENHWQSGLLENWEGNTTQHFRPTFYG